MRYQHVCLEAFGYVLPDEIVTSDELERGSRPPTSGCGCPRAGWS